MKATIKFLAPALLGAALATGALQAAAQADGIYKWVDEDGMVHYGTNPPKDSKSVETVRKPKHELLREREAAQRAALAAANVGQAPAEDAASTGAEQEAPQTYTPNAAEQSAEAQRCNQAKANLETLQTRSRVKMRDKDGNVRMLSEEEHQQKITEAQYVIQESCK